MIDGALNLYKPVGITSAKALYRVRKIIGVRKSGHAGTLDPGASGILVIGLGKGTRLTEAWMDQPKTYRATARLDVTSSSFDSDRPLQSVSCANPPSEMVVAQALARFQGRIEQVPPNVSAVKVGGRRAYRLERAGTPMTLPARPVEIYSIVLGSFVWPTVQFDVCCGRGTYIRAIVRDLGVALGTGGCLTALIRTAIGPFHVEEAWTFEALAQDHDSMNWLVPLDRVRELLSHTSPSKGETV